MNGKTNAAGTQELRRPSKQRLISLRGLFSIALLVLLPPVGLLFLWNQGVFRTRGRMVLTALATVEMMALCVLLTPRPQLVSQLPLPVAPAAVTPAPQEENLNALYNIEQLLYEQQLAQVLEQGGTASDLLTEEEKLEMANQQNEEAYETTVYSVFGDDAIYYHATKVCRTQTNGRELTVRDALREGLQPCPYCNPPTVTE